MATAVTGAAVNVTVDGTQFDLIEEDSISFDSGESTNDFAYAAEAITETFHESASPTLEWTSTLDTETAGLEAVGVIADGADSGSEIEYAGSRRVSSVDFEYLDADSGTVEWSLSVPEGTIEWSGVDGQNPPTMSFTLHCNAAPTIDNQTTTT